jgi:TRAP-type transport system periplasmic protein
MKNRRLHELLLAMIIVAVVLALSPLSGLAAEISLKIAHVAPTGSLFDVSSIKFAERVAANTKGKVEVKVFNNSQLGSAPELFAQVKTGAIDFHLIDVGAVSMIEPDPKNLSITQAPYLFDSQAHLRKFYKSELGQAMLAKVDKANNMKFLGLFGDSVPRGFSTTNRRIVAPADLKGLKLRVPPYPLFVGAYKAWGATPTPVSPKELYTSVKSGMVDGMDHNIVDLYDTKYYEIQKYFTAIDYIYSAMGCWINAKKWDSFPEDVKTAIAKSAQEADAYVVELLKKQVTVAEKGFKDAGLEIIHPDLKPWKDIAEKEAAANDGKFWEKGLYEKIRALR